MVQCVVGGRGGAGVQLRWRPRREHVIWAGRGTTGHPEAGILGPDGLRGGPGGVRRGRRPGVSSESSVSGASGTAIPIRAGSAGIGGGWRSPRRPVPWSPHPVLAPSAGRKPLCWIERPDHPANRPVLKTIGIDLVHVVRFDRAQRRRERLVAFRDLLVRRLQIRAEQPTGNGRERNGEDHSRDRSVSWHVSHRNR